MTLIFTDVRQFALSVSGKPSIPRLRKNLLRRRNIVTTIWQKSRFANVARIASSRRQGWFLFARVGFDSLITGHRVYPDHFRAKLALIAQFQFSSESINTSVDQIRKLSPIMKILLLSQLSSWFESIH